MAADLLGELVGVAGVIGELDHFVPLVMVSEDHKPPAELGLRRGNPTVHVLVCQTEIRLGKRLALRDVLLLVLRQDGQQHGTS